MDNQSLDCYQDLTKLAANLQGRLALGSVRHDKHVREEGRKMLPRCFTCKKIGNKSHECRFNPSSGSNGSDVKPSIVCYFCHEIGHKSPDCPQKLSSHNDQKRTTPTTVLTLLLIVFRIAVHSKTWRTEGTVMLMVFLLRSWVILGQRLWLFHKCWLLRDN